MPYLGLKLKGRNKGRNTLLIHTINHRQNASCQEHMEVKQPFLPYGKLDLCNDYILKVPEYIDCFCINFPCHCVLKQVHLDTDLLDNLVSRKKVVQPTKKLMSVGPHKSGLTLNLPNFLLKTTKVEVSNLPT